MDQFSLDYLDGETWADRTRRLGEGLGYPKCCIDEFIVADYTNRPTRKFTGTGYVPCESCNEKTHEELEATINANRKCPQRFPNEPWPQQIVFITIPN